MKGKKIFAIIMSMCCVISCACQRGAAEGDVNGQTPDASVGGGSEAGQTQTGDVPEEKDDFANQEGGVRETLQERALTQEELQTFTDLLNADENYGFLYSVYADPSEIDLNEVFYCGAGIAQEPMSEAEETAYLSAVESDELYTDVTRIEKEKLEEFVERKTGLTYDQMKRPLEWIYLEEYDIYCSEHGDTNYQPYVCVEGKTADETVFTLRFRRDEDYFGAEGESIDHGYHKIDRELTVKKQANGYQFCSNRMMTEAERIDEQTFSVTVPEYGEVTVAAYAPYAGQPQADVTFLMLGWDGQVIQTLSGTCENNLRGETETFDSVKAVGFQDYNGDGITDMIAIVAYSYAGGPDAGTGFEEIRVYEGNEYGYFYYEQALSDTVNAQCVDATVQSVCDFLAGVV